MAKTPKQKRKSAVAKRTAAVKEMKAVKNKGSAKWKAKRDKVIKASAKVRKQGDIMRKASGREKGEKTKFTGAQKKSTIQAIKDLQAADPKMYVGSSLQETDWTKANVSLMNKIDADNYADRRKKWDQMWADDRAGMIKKQKNELTRLKNANLLDTIELDEDTGSGKVKATPKITGGSEYLATDYDRPAFQDWSDLAPPEMPGLLGSAKAQQDLLGSGMAAYQPWAQPATPYQPPAGPTYATRASLLGGSSPSVSGTGDDTTAGGDTTKTSATSGTFMGQNYANQGEYMMLLDTHNKAMQLIRGGRTTRGIGDLMSNPGWVNTEYVKFGGTDIDVGKKSASFMDTLLGRGQDATTQLADAGQAGGGALSAYNTVNPDQRFALSNVRAPLAAPAQQQVAQQLNPQGLLPTSTRAIMGPQAQAAAMAAAAANPYDFGSANQIITALGGPQR